MALWGRCAHVQHVDTQLNIAMRTVSGALRPTNINWLPVLSNMEPPQIRRDRRSTRRLSSSRIVSPSREPPKARLRSRRPFVTEAAGLACLNQTEQETWKQSWIEGVPSGHDVMTNPTCPQPGFTLPRRQFVTLNRGMWPGQMCQISLPMGRDRITCFPLQREPPDHKAHC